MTNSILSFIISFTISLSVGKYMNFLDENCIGIIGKLLVCVILYIIAFAIIFFTLCFLEIVPYEMIKISQEIEKIL